ncbi:efflux RND transporter periplasmic adaptor subunit [Paenibacillus sp. J5C_2022]|uniref:efflux RND transporter periplasmic adaptor subunit n=1 Tax=Paenibacillus sp. J5C2022 TaxID=2977129 RepID=UPI0021D0E0CE|nr:efflux RND transporter periplasmic adaptor subunit [Paenibacillus sp. J5C2022]MCU6708481.1 efflux RND transporter periplasmic adaptor subunit [Paenibacillus sp. J5C2022]
MRKGWKIALSVILIAGSATAGGYYYWSKGSSVESEAAASFRTALAARGNIKTVVSGTGTVVAEERAVVKAGVGGEIAELNVKEGERVDQGQVLLSFQKEDTSRAVRQLELDIEKLRLQLRQYETQYKEEAAKDQEDSALASLDIQMKGIKLDIEGKQAELAEKRDEGQVTEAVMAPLSGTVITVDAAAGDTVQGSTVVAEIVNYEELVFIAEVDELDIPLVKEGMPVGIYLNALPEEEVAGTIIGLAKEGTVSGGVASYEITIGLRQHQDMLAGMSGQAEITIESRENIITVPVEAVIELQGKSFVRIPAEASGEAEGDGEIPQRTASQQQRPNRADGQTGMTGFGRMSALAGSEAELREVKVGISDENNVEIISGLQEGEAILLPLPQGEVGTSAQQEQMMRAFGEMRRGNGGTGQGGGFGGMTRGSGGFSPGSFGGAGGGGGR